MSERPRVFVARVIPAAELDLVRAAAEAEVWPQELPPPRGVLLQKVQGVDGLL
jgi:glyoxylate reductase